MTFQNPLCDQFNFAALSAPTVAALSRIPANLDADKADIAAMFRATGLSVSAKNEALDAQGQPVPGVRINVQAGDVYTARCSLKGLIALSQDQRVRSLEFNGRPLKLS